MKKARPATRTRFRASHQSTGFALLLFLIAGAAPHASAADTWPGWRGPHGNGTTTTASNLPETWSLEQNIKWKQPLPAWSGSSPAVWDDRIFLNSPSSEVVAAEPAPSAAEPAAGTRRRPGFSRGLAMNGPGGQEILLLCLSRATGAELWRKQYDQGNEIQMKHNMSSPTPVTDGQRVWVVSGNGMLACFDFDGNEQWTLDIVATYGKIGTFFGYGSSPLLLDGKLILQVLHGGRTDEPSYVFALNASDGQVLWRVERPTDAIHETPDAYSTPTVLETGGRKQIVVSGGGYVTGHDTETGAERWRVGGLNPNNARDYRVISSPVVRDGILFVPTRKTPLLALKADGNGGIAPSDVLWSWTGNNAPDVPTPVSDGPRFYMADDAGAITCLDAKTGTVIYGPEDTGIGRVSGSPILADGKIYITSETAETAVIAAGPHYRLLAKNTLDGTYSLSTPAFVGEEIFVRTASHLYCISK